MISKILYWIPRILAIISILFMTMFSFDVFGGNESFGMKMLGFLAHNIPVFILVAILIVAWKWEMAGGALFILASISGTVFFHSFSGNPGSLIVIAPFLLIGILFILHAVFFGVSPVKKNI
jgi:prepilin signal peptidase PulO-like enzyme (type II secretory pathway)